MDISVGPAQQGQRLSENKQALPHPQMSGSQADADAEDKDGKMPTNTNCANTKSQQKALPTLGRLQDNGTTRPKTTVILQERFKSPLHFQEIRDP